MLERLNCWEVRQCGREIGGKESWDMGVCPAALEASLEGINGGRNGGRICWAIGGTFCEGKIQGTYAQKQITCLTCSVFKQVQEEEGKTFRLLP